MSSQRRRAGARPHILVVCDLEMFRWELLERLASAGYEVTGCPSVWRAHKMVGSGRFALAILDLPADEILAREWVRFLRISEVRIKLLALTDLNRTIIQHPLDVDHITGKPLHADALLDSVARLIGSSSRTRGSGVGRLKPS